MSLFLLLLFYSVSPRLLKSLRSFKNQGSPTSKVFGLLFPGISVEVEALQVALEGVLSVHLPRHKREER